MYYNTMMKYIFVLLMIMLTGFSSVAYAVETAPRITDREIIESLVTLKAGQRSLEKRFDEQAKSVNQRFDEQAKSVNQRFDSIQSLILVMLAGIFGLIGFIVWDRRTFLKPIEKRLDRLEESLENDLEIQNKAGSRLTRLVKALQELARTDTKVAKILRQLSLM